MPGGQEVERILEIIYEAAMENDEEVAIGKVFEKEIGMDLHDAIDVLNKGGISVEDLEEITNMLKNDITEEVERRQIPYEYRFILLNVIFCTMFQTAATFHRKFMKVLKDIEKNESKDIESQDIESQDGNTE